MIGKRRSWAIWLLLLAIPFIASCGGGGGGGGGEEDTTEEFTTIRVDLSGLSTNSAGSGGFFRLASAMI